MPKKFIITEIRKNAEGREFTVETYVEAESIQDVLDRVRNQIPQCFLDNKFKIKELKDRDLLA